MQVFVVQNLVFPSLFFLVPDVLYVRVNDRGFTDPSTGSLTFLQGGTASFDTFYNGLSLGAWKRMTVIDSLDVRLNGRGTVRLQACLHQHGQPDRLLLEQDVRLDGEGKVPVDLPWNQINEGMLYIRLEALTVAEITGGCFATRTPVVRDVHLGIVITHFNRKSYVLPAIRRIRDHLLNCPDYQGKISLIVVDNSQTLTTEETSGAILLPNRNLGGSGGFARGLLYLADARHYTHCLFMDDDASCEIESIRRAFVLQSFAREQTLAVAGALLSETDPCHLLEKGATFTRGCARPLHFMRDMSRVDDLLNVEQAGSPSAYGAWWFFCFAVSQVRSFPFPFFVRGDDILFGLTNRFQIETLNGIACWGEDFRFKENPTTRYLGLRSTLAIALMIPSVTSAQLLRMMLGWMLSSLLSCNYGSAQAVLNAIRDVGRGPSFWLEDMDASASRAELVPLNAMEKPVPLTFPVNLFGGSSAKESCLHRLLRIVTLNGFLLPGFLIRNAMVIDQKAFHGTYRRIFRYQRVMYVCPAIQTGYVTEYDRTRFFSLLTVFIRISFVFMLWSGVLRRAYQQARPEMTSAGFWREVYKEKSE